MAEAGIRKPRIGAIGLALVALALLTVAGWTIAGNWRPATDAYPVQGIDVSDEQGPIDWPTVKAGGADFGYIRATRGAALRDTQFAANWAGAYAADLRRGATHAFVLCRPAVAQARNFMVVVPRTADALPAAVVLDPSPECDAPPPRAVLVAELVRFIGLIERHTGKPVLVRVAPDLERRYHLADALDRPLWATRRFLPPTYFARPWRLWQANPARRIDGAERAVGWDVVAP